MTIREDESLDEKMAEQIDQSWIDRWDERYGNTEFAYGELPNNYLREQLEKLNPGTILFPAEGEGRNAVFAAKNGWTVSAFDISAQGRNKATQLAAANRVSIDYKVGSLEVLEYGTDQFDAIALIYSHFPSDIKSQYHKTLGKYLRRGGWVIFESFSKRHIDYISKDEKIGGPKDIAMLFSLEEIESDFANYDIIELVEQEIELSEGLFHYAKGSVIRFVGRKK